MADKIQATPDVKEEHPVNLPRELQGLHIKLVFAPERNTEAAKAVREILKQSYIDRHSAS